MRSLAFCIFTVFGLISAAACTSTGGGSGEGASYDGTADGMDSLPDCGPDTTGSLFWVKEKNAAFECGKTNEWKQRKNAKKPDDAFEDEKQDSEAVTPRIVK